MTRYRWQVIGFTVLVFVAALLPRLYALGTFLTIDEVKWAEGALQFLLALQTGDLAKTYWHFFPGITIAWGGALTLWAICLPAPNLAQCAQTQVEHLPQSIGWLRFTPVLLTSLGISGVYLLGRKLVTDKVALLAALLLAFDPFFIAHSRILNGDAVTAILMFLSLLAFAIYGRTQSVQASSKLVSSSLRLFASALSHPFLILSGALAGLALLTKLPAPLLGLFIGGLGLVVLLREWSKAGWTAGRRWLGILVGWGLIALVTVILFWPALWVAPVETLNQMYLESFEVGEVGEGHDAFFLGQTLDDPGPWFYPYALAFRLTPVVMLGLLMTIVWSFSHIKQANQNDNLEIMITWIVLVYIIFIVSLSSISPKKLDRYVMGVIPALIFLSAIGLAKIGQGSKGARGQGSSFLSSFLYPPKFSKFLLIGLVAIHLISALLAAPYYLTYYNPLLGGPQRAATQVPVGWGEGLEQAAHYLNTLPGAESLAVSAWYGDVFHLYFRGEEASFSDDGRAQLAADYVVFYINQIQRQKPYPGLINYFRAKEPVFVVDIGALGNMSNEIGAQWVEVYQAPAAQSASGAPKIEGVAQLLAYKVMGSRVANGQIVASNAADLSSKDEISVTLFLRILGPLPEKTAIQVTLSPISNLRSPISWLPASIKGEWVEGAVIEWPGTLSLPTDLPPGEYRLKVTLQKAADEVIAEFAISEKDPPLTIQ